MRLDNYLKVSRLIKRRTVANEACDLGRITVNARVARASYDVKVGDRIAIHFGERTLAVEVLSVADNVGKADAAALYRELPNNCRKAGITRTRLPYTLVYGRSFFQEVPLCLTIPFPPLPPTASSSTGASA